MASVVGNAVAVAVDPGQKAILEAIAEDWPQLKQWESYPGAPGAWNATNIANACEQPLAGVSFCDSDGWVTTWSLESDDPSQFINSWSSSFTQMSRLQMVSFSGSWKGALDPNWSLLTNLNRIALTAVRAAPDTVVTGSIPDSWQSLVNLKTLGINKMTGMNWTLPSWFENLDSLERLEIYGSALSGTIPDYLASLPSLTILTINGNPNLQGPIPAGLGTNATSLVILNLQYNGLNGELPSSWSGASQLKTLLLGGNQFQGPLPMIWPAGIETISISDGGLSGALTEALFEAIPNIVTLDIDGNLFEGTIPLPAQGVPTKLRALAVDRNRFTAIGSRIWSIPSLQTLTASSNPFSSPLPSISENETECGLEYVRIGYSSLPGPLPVHINRCNLLRTFSVTDSPNLMGQLPPTWAQQYNMSDLSLANNSLSGPLPDDWSNSESLRWLDLSLNSFEGTIPASIISLSDKNLESLSLQYNDFLLCSSASGALASLGSKISAIDACNVSYQDPNTQECDCSEFWSTCLDANGDPSPICGVLHNPSDDPFGPSTPSGSAHSLLISSMACLGITFLALAIAP